MAKDRRPRQRSPATSFSGISSVARSDSERSASHVSRPALRATADSDYSRSSSYIKALDQRRKLTRNRRPRDQNPDISHNTAAAQRLRQYRRENAPLEHHRSHDHDGPRGYTRLYTHGHGHTHSHSHEHHEHHDRHDHHHHHPDDHDPQHLTLRERFRMTFPGTRTFGIFRTKQPYEDENPYDHDESDKQLQLVRPPRILPSRTTRPSRIGSGSGSGAASASASDESEEADASSHHGSHSRSHPTARSTTSTHHRHAHFAHHAHQAHHARHARHATHTQHHHHHRHRADTQHQSAGNHYLRLTPEQFRYTDWRGTSYEDYASWSPVEQSALEGIIAYYGRITGHAYKVPPKFLGGGGAGGGEGGRSGAGKNSGSSARSSNPSSARSSVNSSANSKSVTSRRNKSSNKDRTQQGEEGGEDGEKAGGQAEKQLSERHGLKIRSVKWKDYQDAPSYMTVFYTENEEGEVGWRDDQVVWLMHELVRVEYPFDPSTGELEHKQEGNKMRRFLLAKVK